MFYKTKARCKKCYSLDNERMRRERRSDAEKRQLELRKEKERKLRIKDEEPERYEKLMEKQRERDSIRNKTEARINWRREFHKKNNALHRLRCRIRHVFRSNGIRKTNSTLLMLGLTKDELQEKFPLSYIQDKEIDHILPLAIFSLNNPRHALCANHYLNLRVISKEENRSKSKKVIQLPDGMHGGQYLWNIFPDVFIDLKNSGHLPEGFQLCCGV